MRVRLIGFAIVSSLAGCVAAPPPPPPSPLPIVAPSRAPDPPATRQVWQPAGWHRVGDDYVWVKGHYVTVKIKRRHWVHRHRSSDGALVPGHWES